MSTNGTMEEKLHDEFVGFVVATGQMHSRFTAEALWETTPPEDRVMYIEHAKINGKAAEQVVKPSVIDVLTERISKLTFNNGLDAILSKDEKLTCLSFGERAWYHTLNVVDRARPRSRGDHAEGYLAKMEPEISFRYTVDTIELYDKSIAEVTKDLANAKKELEGSRNKRNEITERILVQKKEYDQVERFCAAAEKNKKRVLEQQDKEFDYDLLKELNEGNAGDVEPKQQRMEDLLDNMNADSLFFQMEDQNYRSWKCTSQAYDKVLRRLKVDQRYLQAFCKRTRTETNLDVLRRALDFLQKYEGFVAGISQLSRAHDRFNNSVAAAGLNPNYLTGLASQAHGKDLAEKLKSVYGQNKRTADEIVAMVKRRIYES